MNAAQKVCWKAAQLIERDGWCQYAYEFDGRHCMSGALALGAVDGEGVGTWAYFYVRYVAGIKPSLAHWNDRKGRTAEEVIDVLVAAACGEWE